MNLRSRDDTARPAARALQRRGASRGCMRVAMAGALALALATCGTPPELQREPSWKRPTAGAAVSEHPLATEVALDILTRGGNAADAAVAAALTLAVVYPQAGNLGGGGFALFVPHTGAARAIDFRETAPFAADVERFRRANGELAPERARSGPLSVGVPGSPAGLAELYKSCGSGRFTLAELARPAIELAQRGFVVDEWLAHDLAEAGLYERMNSAARSLFFPGGAPLAEGVLLRQTELAQTLSLFANGGASAFYSGRIADAIAAELDATPLPDTGQSSRGWITAADLARYRPTSPEPLHGWFRGVEVITMPPPSSGGVLLLQALGILEGLPLDAERTKALVAHRIESDKGAPPAREPALSERMVHWWIEALRRAFADRAAHLGDPDFGRVPVAELLSPSWIAERRISIGEAADPHVPAWVPPREGAQTTHLSVLDARGNAVSLTTTLNSTFGSGILVRGGGFLLNNEIDDFALAPAQPNQFGLVGGAANALEPGKRPLSSMTPSVLREGGHAASLVIGSPGGPRIISAVLQVVLRTLVLDESIEDAVRAPRLHQQWSPAPTRFEPGWDADILAALANLRGHAIEISPTSFGSIQAIWVAEPGAEPVAVSDPRRGGAAGVQGRPLSVRAPVPQRAEPTADAAQRAAGGSPRTPAPN